MSDDAAAAPASEPDSFWRRWRAEILIGVALAALLAGALTFESRQAARDEAAQRAVNLESFDRAWGLLRDRHFDPDLGGVDWAAVRDELRPRVAETKTREEGRAVLREMLARLGQSHLTLLPEEVLATATYVPESGTAGVDLVLLDGRAIVRVVAAGSAAERAGIRAGWELVRVDGLDVAERLARLDRELPPSSRRRMDRTDAVSKLLHGPIGSTRSLALVDSGGATVERRVTLARPPGRLAQIGNLPAGYVDLEVERRPDGILRIALDAFIYPAYAMRALNETLASNLDARGLVLDLRGNGGGLPEMVTGLLGWLTPERLDIGSMVTRDGETRVVVPPRPESYAGPVAVLVDERSVSGAELFAHAVRQLPDARVFGAATAGAVQGGIVERLPSGDALMFPYSDFRTPEGESLEGVGVTPDVAVRPTRAELLAGVDRVLETAIEWIASRPAPDGPAARRDGAEVAKESTGAPAPDRAERIDPRAAEVLDAFVAATGGAAAYRALTTRVIHATLTLGGPGGVEIALTTYLARPVESLTIESSDYMGEARFGSHQGLAWESTLFYGPRRLDPARRALLLRSVGLDGPAGWRSRVRRADALGIEPVDGRPAHHVRVETDSGFVEEQWYDCQSALQVKAATRLPPSLGNAPAETYPSDYRPTGGILLPYRQRTFVLGQERRLAIDSVEHDVELADDLFEPPAELRRSAPSPR